uniref:DNA-directed RNA polymerase III subunit RPC9 n=1 Tax=Angiostrongylus cantonensis TaxID=6313 RepID=A0A0K0DMV8_ANGCA
MQIPKEFESRKCDELLKSEFEVAQIVNLCPKTAGEAKAFISSLKSKLQGDDLNEVLRNLHTKKSFQYAFYFKLYTASLLTYCSWSVLLGKCAVTL